MNEMFEDLKEGLNDAINDAKSNNKFLKRNTIGFIKPIFLVSLFFLLLILFSFYFINYRKEKLAFSKTNAFEMISELKNENKVANSLDDMDIYDTLTLMFYDEKIWDRLPLSTNFINKYNKKNQIIKEINE